MAACTLAQHFQLCHQLLSVVPSGRGGSALHGIRLCSQVACSLVSQTLQLLILSVACKDFWVYRLWLHELRGRLDVAFIRIAGLRTLGSDFEEIRREVARTFFNYNSRLQVVEDSVEETLAAQSAALQSLETRLQRGQLLGLLLCIFFLQTLRLLVEISHQA